MFTHCRPLPLHPLVFAKISFSQRNPTKKVIQMTDEQSLPTAAPHLYDLTRSLSAGIEVCYLHNVTVLQSQSLIVVCHLRSFLVCIFPIQNSGQMRIHRVTVLLAFTPI
jgi:hypothetical protein